MDSVDFFLDGREGGNDLTFRLVKANDIVSVVPVSVFLVVSSDDDGGKIMQCFGKYSSVVQEQYLYDKMMPSYSF